MSRILVVDDESLMREFISESLSSKGYEVDAAENGAKALCCRRYGLELVVRAERGKLELFPQGRFRVDEENSCLHEICNLYRTSEGLF